ncbi:MAG: aminotransferase class I/II-fold pyridoxal phosphate-dependent enzyme, partial [Methanomassiliicoccaceae archaeon]|nr:aminotransferase class I/II-fold pyridoxal phosphate-dependent enzyme [Methanomassiliicoccaceae archaeon]
MVKYGQSDRLRKLPPYLFVRLEELAAAKRKEGMDMIDFGIGDPDLPTPDKIVKSLQIAVQENDFQKYSSSQGEKDLREAIARWYKKRFGVEVDPATQVCITLGSKEAIFNISQAFVNPGEMIIAPSPGYPVYSGASTLFNEAKCILVPLKAEKGWLLDVDECPADAKMLYINYPNNPTGATCDLPYLKKVYDWCQDTNTILCFDNAYSEMCYDDYRAPSMLQIGPNCIEFGSFSKTFNMTGYRLGYAVGHPDLVEGLKKCKGQIDSGA